MIFGKIDTPYYTSALRSLGIQYCTDFEPPYTHHLVLAQLARNRVTCWATMPLSVALMVRE